MASEGPNQVRGDPPRGQAHPSPNTLRKEQLPKSLRMDARGLEDPRNSPFCSRPNWTLTERGLVCWGLPTAEGIPAFRVQLWS